MIACISWSLEASIIRLILVLGKYGLNSSLAKLICSVWNMKRRCSGVWSAKCATLMRRKNKMKNDNWLAVWLMQLWTIYVINMRLRWLNASELEQMCNLVKELERKWWLNFSCTIVWSSKSQPLSNYKRQLEIKTIEIEASRRNILRSLPRKIWKELWRHMHLNAKYTKGQLQFLKQKVTILIMLGQRRKKLLRKVMELKRCWNLSWHLKWWLYSWKLDACMVLKLKLQPSSMWQRYNMKSEYR